MYNKVFQFQNGLIILILIILFRIKLTATKDNLCFISELSNTSWTDRRPYFAVNMTFNQGMIRSKTWVNQDIAFPIVKIRIIQKEGNDKISTLFNITARLCEVQQFIKTVPMFKQAYLTAIKNGNYSFSCPLKQGFYVMDNMRVRNRNPMLAFMYRPKTSFTFMGGVYEEAPNKSLLPLSTYRFTATIVKKSCKES